IERRRASVVCVRRVEERRIFGKIGKWLMMELEYDVRIVCRLRIVLQRHVPATGIPFPANPGVIEPVANRDDVAGLRWIGVVNQQAPGWIGGARRERGLCRLDCVYAVLAVERELIIVQLFGGWIITGLPAGRNCCSPRRSLRRNQPLVIEKRT